MTIFVTVMVVFAGVGLLVVTAAVVYCLCVKRRRRKGSGGEDAEGGTRQEPVALETAGNETRAFTTGIPNRAFNIEGPLQNVGQYESLSPEDEQRIRAIVDTMQTSSFNLQVLVSFCRSFRRTYDHRSLLTLQIINCFSSKDSHFIVCSTI